MKLAFIFGVAIAAVTAPPAMADDWRLVSYTDTYPAVVVLVDAESVSRAGGKVIFRSQSFFESPLSGGTTRTVEMMDTDCAGTSYRTLSGVYYGGSTVIERKQAVSEHSATAGSMNEGMIFSACGKQDYLSGSIPDPVKYADDYFYELELEAWDY